MGTVMSNKATWMLGFGACMACIVVAVAYQCATEAVRMEVGAIRRTNVQMLTFADIVGQWAVQHRINRPPRDLRALTDAIKATDVGMWSRVSDECPMIVDGKDAWGQKFDYHAVSAGVVRIASGGPRDREKQERVLRLEVELFFYVDE